MLVLKEQIKERLENKIASSTSFY